MAWSLRLNLYGECRLGAAPGEPVDAQVVLRRLAPRRFDVRGQLSCPLLGSGRELRGLWRWPDPLELELESGWSYTGRSDQTAAKALLRRSLWNGALLEHGTPRGSLRLRLDLRHEWLQVLRSVRP